jgi:PKD repeat protein
MKKLSLVVILLLGLTTATAALAQGTFGSPGPHAVVTFHSIGLYWAPGGTATAQVEFKEQGEALWRRGLDLWYDARNSEYRGSLVELRAGTTYDIRLTRSGASGATFSATTWSENFSVPTGHTVTVPSGTTRVVVNPSSAATPSTSTSGTTFTVNAPTASGGFTKITANAGQNVILGSSTSTNDECILLNHGVRNVLITGLVLQGCKRWGIRFLGGSAEPRTQNIVIDGNEFVGWGAFGQETAGLANDDGAIYCNFSAPVKPERIVMQRNVFRDPRHGANPWGPNQVHPKGPHAYYFSRCGGNHVFRYNDVHANGNGNHYNDALGGCCNFQPEGSPGNDSDIYGNRISHVYDDAIEAEGGNRNVRIWGNYIDKSMVAIGNAATVTGPLYVWRNISNDMALKKNPGATDEGVDSRGPFVKAASNSSNSAMNGGRTYYFHNTLLQPPSQQSQPYPRGAGYGLNDSGGSLPLYNFVSLNNIWHIHKVPQLPNANDYRSIQADCNVQGPCTADYDLFNGLMVNAGTNPEPNGWGNVTSGDESSVPTYASSNGPYPAAASLPSATNGWTGNFELASTSLGYGGAVTLFNFNDQHSNPDVGAHQSGAAPMKFGVAAASAATPPNAQMSATPTSGTAPLNVSFDATSSTPGSAPISSYTINFGDGTPNGSGAQQSHSYASAGTYVATLTVTDANGASDTFTQTLQVSTAGGGGGGGSTPFEMGLSANPGLAVNRGEGIVFGASAVDGRALQSVRFYYDGVLKLTDTTAPFQYSWTSSASDTIGNHTLAVEMTDTAGTTMTETRTITILPAACGIFVTAAAVVQGETLGVQSVCSAWENPERLDLIVNDFIIRRDAARPYTWLLDTGTLTLGSHAVRVRGVLGAGRESNASVNVEVLPGPLAISVSPGPTVVRGEPVTITAAATDGRALRQVDFFVDGHFRAGENVAPFQHTWTGNDGYGRLDAFGRHTLVVQATDLNGNVLTASRELYALTQACNALGETSRYQVGGHDTVATGAIAVTQGQIFTVHGLCSAARTVQQVDFFVNGTRLGGDAIAPYGWPVPSSTLAPGSHTLSIKGILADGSESNHSILFEIVAP